MEGNKTGLTTPSFFSFLLGRGEGKSHLWKIAHNQFDGLNKDLGRRNSSVMNKRRMLQILKNFLFKSYPSTLTTKSYYNIQTPPLFFTMETIFVIYISFKSKITLMKYPQTQLMESTNIWRRLHACFHSELNYVPFVSWDRQRVMSEITIGGSFPHPEKMKSWNSRTEFEQTKNTLCLEYLWRVRREGECEREIHKPEIVQAGDLLVLTTPTYSLKSVGFQSKARVPPLSWGS